MSGINNLGYNPMDSVELNNTFQTDKIININEKIDYLIKLGINPIFAEQLEAMRKKYSYSTATIMQYEPEIIAANNRINDGSTLLYSNGYSKIKSSLIEATA